MPRRKPSRLLVTGGAGFIGANFVRFWLRRHPESRVVVLDALTYAGNRANLAGFSDRPNFRFVHGNIGDRPLVEQLLREEDIDTIVHLAAETHVDRSVGGPEAFIDSNVRGTFSLLEAARSLWLSGRPGRRGHFHHVSTDEVFGSLEMSDPPFTERSPYRPSSPYAASKAAADHLVNAYHRTFGLEVTISNCSNNYGAYQFPEKLVPLMMLHLLLGRELPIYGDGENVRDWLHVDDHCAGLELIIERGQVGRSYNLGGGCEQSNREIVATICRLADALFEERPELAERYPEAPPAVGEPCASRVVHVRDRPGHDRRYAIDFGRAASELGFKPTHDLTAGLTQTLHWYVDNEEWWRELMGI